MGVFVGDFTGPGGTAALGERLAAFAVRAERAGAASLWLNDHLFQIPMFGGEDDPVPEPWTALAFVAARTSRIELGTLTTSATYRHPGVLLKTVATLDVLSGGRPWLGIGPPWHEREQRDMGIPVGSWPERFARLEEILRLTRQVWDGDTTPFAGEHYRLDRPRLPAAAAPPPILVGGAHERRVLRLVARYADACNLFEAGGLPMLRLSWTCCGAAAAGRPPYDDILRTTFGALRAEDVADPRAAHRRFQDLADSASTWRSWTWARTPTSAGSSCSRRWPRRSRRSAAPSRPPCRRTSLFRRTGVGRLTRRRPIRTRVECGGTSNDLDHPRDDRRPQAARNWRRRSRTGPPKANASAAYP
ncbi:LLM class flavin-dependent oxidoreductase [Micromonospora sp. BRA006-A]|nr:LLM class flavin-dependent oxidoreductase [Micromonospora sp. BRA006-A]